MLWHAVGLALGKLIHGGTGGRPAPSEVIMSRLPPRHAFIDKLAGTIAQRVLEDVCIVWISATIRKPVALDNGESGVTIRREQEG
jgi:hypothetical protein